MNTENRPHTLRDFLKLDNQRIFIVFFFGILLFLLYQLLRVLSPFGGAILMAAIVALIFYPVNERLVKILPDRNNITASLSTMLAVITLILPLLFFGWLLVREARVLYPATTQWLSMLSSGTLKLPLPDSFILPSGIEIDLQAIITPVLTEINEKLVRLGGSLLRNLVLFIANFAVLVVMLFVFFRDGERLLNWFIDIIPMDPQAKTRVAGQLADTTIAVVRGVLLTAAIQGLIAAAGYYMAGVPSPAVMGMLTAFTALIPFLGTSLVWLPLGLFTLAYKSSGAGIFILIWGATAVSMLDNILRPILIGQQSRLPIFLLFLGIIGGLRTYGPIGILMGPLLISCVIVFLQIYREARRPLQPRPPEGAG